MASPSASSTSSLRAAPYPIQDKFIRCRDRFTGFIGGIGSGKSWAGAVKLLIVSQEQSGLYMIVAPTYPMLRDASLRVLRDVAGKAFPPEALNKGEMVGRLGKSEVLLRSADKPDRLRGANLSGVWIDEAGLCPAGTWEIVIGRLREGGRAGPCWVTTTPKGRNWLYERQAEMTIFRSRTQDNPHLDPEFIRSLEASYAGKFAAQELGGEFVGFEGLVYEEFDRGRHVREAGGPWVRVVAGMDEGYTNPSVILVLGEDGDGRIHVLDEFYQRRVLPAEVVGVAAEMAGRYNVETFYCDPSAAGLIAQMQAAGLDTQAAENAVFLGIQEIKARLAQAGDGRPRLTVAPGCVNIMAEFESYCWKPGRIGLRDEPEKVNDHAMDALRYGGMALAQGRRSGIWL